MHNTLLSSFYLLISALSIFEATSIQAMEKHKKSDGCDSRLIREIPNGPDLTLASCITANLFETNPAISYHELFRHYGRLLPINFIHAINQGLIKRRRNHLIVYNGTSETFHVSGVMSSVYCLEDGRAYINSRSASYVHDDPTIPRLKFFNPQPITYGSTCQFPISDNCTANNQSYVGINLAIPTIHPLAERPEGYCTIATQGAILCIVKYNNLFGFLRRVRLQNNLPVPIKARINLLAHEIGGKVYGQKRYLGPELIEAGQARCFNTFIPFVFTHRYFYSHYPSDFKNPTLVGIRLWNTGEDSLTRKNSLAAIGIALSYLLPLAGDCSQFSLSQQNDGTIALRRVLS